MQSNYFKRVSKYTQTKFWINNVTEEEAHLAIENGAVGCTQNPAYVYKMIEKNTQADKINKLIKKYHEEGKSVCDIEVAIQRDLVKEIADIFYPIYENTGGKQGYVSIQGDPFHEDVDTIIKYALYNCEVAPNIMAKVPVTPDGLKAIHYLLKKGIAINATEVMSVSQAMDVCRVYEDATKGMKEKPVLYYSHISGILDEYLVKTVKKDGISIDKDILWQAGIAAAKKTYQMTKAISSDAGFIGGGARGLHHFTEMVGADACITINWKGCADELLKQDALVLNLFERETPHYVIDELVKKIPDFRKAYFTYELQPEEYEEFGPVVLFRESFEKAWQDAETYIKQIIEK